MGFPTLEFLAKTRSIVDVDEVGLKTEGLINLIRAKEHFERLPERERVSYEVPPGFVVPVSARLDKKGIEQLRDAWSDLTSGETLHGYMVRSSHHDEQPGEFESIPVTFDAKNPVQSFSNFARAVLRVRRNPDKAVVVQRMVGRARPKTYVNQKIASFPLFDDSLDFVALGKTLETHRGKNDYFELTLFSHGRRVSRYDRGRFLSDFDPRSVKDFFADIREDVRSDALDETQWYRQVANIADIDATLIARTRPISPSLGSQMSGFIARSHSHIDPTLAIISSAFGLPTKLVGPADELSVLMRNAQGSLLPPGSTGHTYDMDGGAYVQKMMDVFDLNSGKIAPWDLNIRQNQDHILRFPTEIQVEGTMHYFELPFDADSHAQPVFALLDYFAQITGRPVELEGIFDYSSDTRQPHINVVQLTQSYFLPNYIDRLTPIKKERAIFQLDRSVIGSINFTGDVVAYFAPVDDISNSPYAAISYHRDFATLLLNRLSSFDPSKTLVVTNQFFDCLPENGFTQYVLLPSRMDTLHMANATPSENSSAHIFGYMTSQIHKRTLLGHTLCAAIVDQKKIDISRRFPGFEDRVERGDHFTAFRNVAVEATCGDLQMYFR